MSDLRSLESPSTSNRRSVHKEYIVSTGTSSETPRSSHVQSKRVQVRTGHTDTKEAPPFISQSNRARVKSAFLSTSNQQINQEIDDNLDIQTPCRQGDDYHTPFPASSCYSPLSSHISRSLSTTSRSLHYFVLLFQSPTA